MEYYSYPLMIKSNHSSKPVSFIPITIMDTFPNHTITSISQTFSIESSDLLSYDLEDCQSINISSHPEKQNLLLTPNFDNKNQMNQQRKKFQNLHKEAKGYITIKEKQLSISVCSVLIDVISQNKANIQFKLKLIFHKKEWSVRRTLKQLSALLQFYELSFISTNITQRASIERIINLLVQKDRVRNTKAFQKFIKLKSII